MLRLDDIDHRIIAFLARDGRSSFRTIGESVGLSAPAVKRRVDRLVDAGVIEGFTAVVDPRRLGWTTEAFIELFCEGRTPPAVIRTTPHLEATLERIRSEPFIVRTRSVIVLSRLIERQVPTQREPGTGTGTV
ncbi:MAG: Lrp/AsnC family transcriptional regulator [Intrasporangiaceae bacterium]|nr:Lrp/AsnC family transcriptional regulator [Intrasporangiaceae bacterium]